jgi:hypothetical protein
VRVKLDSLGGLLDLPSDDDEEEDEEEEEEDEEDKEEEVEILETGVVMICD